MCLSNDSYIRVIDSLMTVLLEYNDLKYSLIKMFIRLRFNESNSNIRNIHFSLTKDVARPGHTQTSAYFALLSALKMIFK